MKSIFQINSFLLFILCVGSLQAQFSVSSEGPFYFTNRANGRVIDVAGYSTEDRGVLHHWEYVGGQNQQWYLLEGDDGHYYFKAVQSGKILTAPDSRKDSEQTYQLQYLGNDHQQFRLAPAGDGYFYLVSKADDRVLGSNRSNSDNGGAIEIQDFSDRSHQQFSLTRVGETQRLYQNVGRDEGAIPYRRTMVVPRPAPPKQWSLSVTNNSMWQVAFRVYDGSWSDWKYVDAGLNNPTGRLSGNGSIQNYEIEWNDLGTWREFGGTPLIPNDNVMKITVSGNTATGIKIN